MSVVYYNFNVFLAYYSIFLAIFGTIGNILSFIICLRPHLRKIPTFIFFAYMMIMHTISLYFWNFNIFILTFYGFTIGDVNLASCRITSYLQGVSFQSSAFLLVTLKPWKSFRF